MRELKRMKPIVYALKNKMDVISDKDLTSHQSDETI